MNDRRQRFAARTSVAPERTKADIERLVIAAGATEFASAWSGASEAAVQFALRGRVIRFSMRLPKLSDERFRSGRTRPLSTRQREVEQAVRATWRALLLVLKAKLEAVATGISTVEHEFLAWHVTRDGRTLGERIIPILDNAVASSDPCGLLRLTGGE